MSCKVRCSEGPEEVGYVVQAVRWSEGPEEVGHG